MKLLAPLLPLLLRRRLRMRTALPLDLVSIRLSKLVQPGGSRRLRHGRKTAENLRRRRPSLRRLEKAFLDEIPQSGWASSQWRCLFI